MTYDVPCLYPSGPVGEWVIVSVQGAEPIGGKGLGWYRTWTIVKTPIACNWTVFSERKPCK